MYPKHESIIKYLLFSPRRATRGMIIRTLLMVFSVFFGLCLARPAGAVVIPLDSTLWHWTDRDNNTGDSSYSYSAPILTIRSYGTDLWTGYDRYCAYYLDNNVSGDFEMWVEIVSQDDSNEWAKAGIMIKNDMTANGSSTGYCIVAITPDYGFTFQRDNNNNGFLDSRTEAASSYPAWVKLKKEGQVFSAYQSSDGTSWTQIGSSWTSTSANTSQDVGLFVSSRSSSHCHVAFRNLNLTSTSSFHIITASAGANGSISPSGSVPVMEGQNQQFDMNPLEGYEVDEVLVDGSPVTFIGSSYTIPDVTDDHTIAVTFKPATCTITVTAGGNGTVSPAGNPVVNWGADQAFTLTPNSGYKIGTVKVNGITQPIDTTYTFTNIKSDQTLEVTFSALSYTITAAAGAHGSISPSGSVAVNWGGSQQFTVTPQNGYLINKVLVNGNNISLTNGQYTFTNVTLNQTIYVSFAITPIIETETPGCVAGGGVTDYSSGFNAADFDLTSVAVTNGALVLQTGQQGIDPNSIVVPFKQEVKVTFLYEGAGYISDFGYVLYNDAVNTDGTFKGWSNIPANKKHPVFVSIIDEGSSCCDGGDGIFNSNYGLGGFPTSSESGVSNYNDGTGLPFLVDGNGTVNTKDMRKSLGTFDAGTELVFWLTANVRWQNAANNQVFFTKKSWNPDTYTTYTGTVPNTTKKPIVGDPHWVTSPTIFNKVFNLGTAIVCDGCWNAEQGWLAQTSIDRMTADFGVTLSGDYIIPITIGQKYPHIVVGAPANDPNQWILGWEDLFASTQSDYDYNDLVFRIERETGGVAQLQSSEAIIPNQPDAYYTAVTFEVADQMPCSGKTNITYSLSIDNGQNWVEITDWDKTYNSTCGSKTKGSEIFNWTPGTPACTYRTVRVDFAARGLSGNQLIWKALLKSTDETCIPQIDYVSLSGSVATNGSFSRVAPIVLGNVIYSGSYETPAQSWVDKTVLRGHLKATRLYNPADPSQASAIPLWDAGQVLSGIQPYDRTIYFTMDSSWVEDEQVGTGNGSTKIFSGTLGYHPAAATTVTITDQREIFHDELNDVLSGDLGGTGTINRFTGEFTIQFNTAPDSGVPIKARYCLYTTETLLKSFNTANVANINLSLDNTYVSPSGYVYDLNNDGAFTEADGDWLVYWVRGYRDGSGMSNKEWLLGPVDHSAPAVLTPPGTPDWYYGTAVTKEEKAVYDTFKEAKEERQTVVFVGARDGMMHAFDGGKFRLGDNPDTGVKENRGYFLWESGSPNYGTGTELWAFIPANLIPRLKNNLLKGDNQSYVDASPTLADVYTNDAWRTVLLSAEGNGGDTVFCLDVTDPIVPKFMWEFGDPDLFRSRSSPAVAMIGRMTSGGKTRYAAFFVSGKTAAATYPSIYLIDIADGSIIRRVFLETEVSQIDALGIGGVPSGQPAIVDSDGNGYIDRIYIGTDKGLMYKVTISDDPTVANDPLVQSVCVINTDFVFTDGTGMHSVAPTQQYHPIYASPSVFVDNTYNAATGKIDYRIRVFFGTGDSPYYDDGIDFGNTRYHFFAYIDKDEKGQCSGADLDWFFELPAGQRIFASAFAAAGLIYFGTAGDETEDPCSANNDGKLYVFDIQDHSMVAEIATGNVLSSPLVEDEHLYVRTTQGLTCFGGGPFNNQTTGGAIGNTVIRSWQEQ